MDEKLRRGFRIGAFSVEPLTGRITGPKGAQHVQPKVMDVLVFLAQHAGELVERDTLLEQVWRRVTSEEVLTRCISELRGVFGDERGTPSYIQTVPKRGYRLLEQIVLPCRATRGGGAYARRRGGRGGSGQPTGARSCGGIRGRAAFRQSLGRPGKRVHGRCVRRGAAQHARAADRLRVAARRSSFVFKNTNVTCARSARDCKWTT